MSDISASFLAENGGRTFADAAAIDAYFATKGGASFISWFNMKAAGRDAWAGKTIPTTQACAANFSIFWDKASDVFGGDPTLVQFVCLMSIFINEVGGNLVPIKEKVGTAGHPGIAYAFDAIPGLKRSYNTLVGNKTALELFQDAAYLAAHGDEALAHRFDAGAHIDPAWGGVSWPAGFPTDTDPTVTGFLLEADFYKFRGRGLIQTTGRAAYLRLVDFVKSYGGGDPVIAHHSSQWNALPSSDAAATASSNDDWDELFLSGTLEIAQAAIRLHNDAASNYLALNTASTAVLGATSDVSGSAFRMGYRISGGSDYAMTFRNRVVQIFNLLA